MMQCLFCGTFENHHLPFCVFNSHFNSIDPIGDFLANLPTITPPLTPEGNTMNAIVVGKITLAPGHQVGRYETTPDEVVSVYINDAGVQVSYSGERGAKGYLPVMTPEQTLLVAQLMMKASELQPKYAEEMKRLAEERANVEKRYQELADGLGVEDVDIDDDHTTFTIIKPALGV